MADHSNPAPLIDARTSSKEAVLRRVRAATASFEPPPIPRDYRRAGSAPVPDQEALVDLFIDRLVDYKADVARCSIADIGAAVVGFLEAEEAARVVVPGGLPADWLPDGSPDGPPVTRLGDDDPLTLSELDAADGVVTGCAVAVAETGTVVLDGGEGQGRRALTLLPDLHVVIVTTDRLVPRVPDALDRLDPRRPLTWISGPSATSDIELDRVEGVHGPRRLRVVVAAR